MDAKIMILKFAEIEKDPRERRQYLMNHGRIVPEPEVAANLSHHGCCIIYIFISAYLGWGTSQTTVNVYMSELLGVHVGLDFAMKSSCCNIIIFTDNQAAFKTLSAPKQQSGRHIIRRIIKTIAETWACGHRTLLDPSPSANRCK